MTHRTKKPFSKQYASRTRRFIPLDRDPFYLESVDKQANPRGLTPTVDWFRENPGAEFRLVASHGRGWIDFTFYPRAPRWAGGYTLFATNLRDVLAEPRFKTGTPRERLTNIFRQLTRNGAFVDPFPVSARQ